MKNYDVFLLSMIQQQNDPTAKRDFRQTWLGVFARMGD
jgi:hypothetical protein